MPTRRQFIQSAPVIVGGASSLAGCASDTGEAAYEVAAQGTWRRAQSDSLSGLLLHRELVRYATLAPSSHNTQCWKFRMEADAISILPDLSRRCPAVDPDDHHLFVSLGCATENLIQAALAYGLKGEARLDVSAASEIQIGFEPVQAVVSSLFSAITERQCTRAEFDGKPVSPEELRILERAGSGDGVRMLLFTKRTVIEQVLEHVIAANTVQMNDPAFVNELRAWIRFDYDQAVQTGDGLFSLCSGHLSVPPWLGRTLFSLFVTPKSESDRYARQLRSSAGVAVIVSEADDRPHWLEAGRCYERFALQATALGIRNALINQPVEVASLRPQFAALLGIGNRRPDLVIRFGRGPRMPQSLRRPVPAVLA